MSKHTIEPGDEYGEAIREANANARVIAKAPEMLDLLESAIARVQLANSEGNPILSGWLTDAARVVAEAKWGSMSDKPQIACCTSCGGTDVRLDAWAEWSFDAQDWVLHSTYDNGFCEECGGACSITYRAIDAGAAPIQERRIDMTNELREALEGILKELEKHGYIAATRVDVCRALIAAAKGDV